MPAGIDRFDARSIETYFGGATRCRGVPVERHPRPRCRGLPGRRARRVQHGRHGPAPLPARQRRLPAARRRQPRTCSTGSGPASTPSEVPIASITNGVHAPTWVDRKVVELAERHAGSHVLDTRRRVGVHRRRGPARRDVETCRGAARPARRRRPAGGSAASWLKRGASAAELGWTNDILDPDVLTIGFARRVPTYKRLTLMLRDPERLKTLLLDPKRPVQIIIAGKSHPADDTGKRLIQQMVKFADDPEVRHRIAFLPNYDIAMAQFLYPGCDVWLNNPLRPFEACGTSGMKSALNGGLNLSILDGWWDEWFDGENGWAIPTADGVEDPERARRPRGRRALRADRAQVAPRFYDRDEDGLPHPLAGDGPHTLSTLGPKVLASRMVRDYIEQLYAPAARAGVGRSGRRVRRRQGPGGLRSPRCARPGGRARRPRRVLRGRRLPAGRRRPARAAFVNLGRRSRRRTSRCRSSTGGSTTTATRSATSGPPRSSSPSPTRAGATGSSAPWAGDPGAFGYTVRVLPKHAGPWPRASWGWSRTPDQPSCPARGSAEQRVRDEARGAASAWPTPPGGREAPTRVRSWRWRAAQASWSAAYRRMLDPGMWTGPGGSGSPGDCGRSQELSHISWYAVRPGKSGRVTVVSSTPPCSTRTADRSPSHRPLRTICTVIAAGSSHRPSMSTPSPANQARSTDPSRAPDGRGPRGALAQDGQLAAQLEQPGGRRQRSRCQDARFQSNQVVSLSWQ